MGKLNDITHINEAMKDIADSQPVATVNELKQKTDVNDRTAYIMADAYTANPSKILGRVAVVRKDSDGKCQPNLTGDATVKFDFLISAIRGFTIDAQSLNSKPELRGSILVDRELCAQAGFLNVLNGQLKQDETFSLVVMDQARGFVNFQDEAWDTAVEAWTTKNKEIMEDENICYIFVVTEFVVKNIIKKKFRKLTGEVRGGAYGVNIGGKLSTSTDEYSLDIIFGITPSVIKRPGVPIAGRRIEKSELEASVDELKLFSNSSGSRLE